MSGQVMVLMHVVWMSEYQGHEHKIFAGGFKWAARSGYGHEMFNFKAIRGHCFGYVEVVQRRIKGNTVDPQLRIESLGAPRGSDSVDNVLVVWTAPNPDKRGRTIVGWYKNATVFRHKQQPEPHIGRARSWDHQVFSYRVKARAEDCVLLPPERRVLTIPPRTKGKKGMPGEFGAFYPHLHSYKHTRDLERKICAFIETGIAQPLGPVPNSTRHGTRQPDPERRKEIEKASVESVWQHFATDLGYTIEDRQSENVGYDLRATKGDDVLCIEVKGRSCGDIVAEFTPNEYATIRLHEQMKFHDGSYRICIVTDALTTPRIHHFSYWRWLERRQSGEWRSLDGKLLLNLSTRVAALGTAVATGTHSPTAG